jgi:hypothetical protein
MITPTASINNIMKLKTFTGIRKLHIETHKMVDVWISISRGRILLVKLYTDARAYRMMFHNRPFKREVSGIAKARKKDLAWGDDKVISKNNSAEVNVLIKGDKLQVKVNFLSVFHIVLFVAG